MSLKKYVFIKSGSVKSHGVKFDVSSFGKCKHDIVEAELTTKEFIDIHRDPSVYAIATPMPLKLIKPMEISDDNINESPWGINAILANNSKYDGSGVTVAVLDTGIDAEHIAFDGVSLVTRNFTQGKDIDENGHGTHCAGTIFGRDVDGKRIGIARGVNKALIGKVIGDGGGSSATIAKAIQWSISEGANVISMSLGIDFPGYVDYLVNKEGVDINAATSMALEAYRQNVNLFSGMANILDSQNIYGKGSIIVAAAGNESKRPKYEISVSPPAAGSGIISVAALSNKKINEETGYSVAYFSNNEVDVSAPGENIISAKFGGGLVSMSGTSMACPHAAGVAVLWASKQLEETKKIESTSLKSQLIASGTFKYLIKGSEEEDVGTGIVQSPV